MTMIERAEFEVYCPVCTRCLSAEDDECPGCRSPRPAGGWQPLEASSYGYLGKVLDGRYIVDRFLGAGTTGDVYRGVGSRIQRPFALKIVDTSRHGRADFEEELRRRLELEVEAMSQLRNPHVVNVYESLQVSDSIFVLVMDYVEGVTLQERLDRTGRLAVDEALEIIRQVANGLHEAHQRGIIHRDLKPDNVMIEQMPAKGIFARILDFGIAYMVDAVHRTAGFRGTPLYASPEQCRSQGRIDARSDIYSLGCVLYHCLTGQPPYDLDRSLAVMEAHLEREVPSIFDVLTRDDAPRRVDRLIRKMLAKDPLDRPPHCGEVISRLDDIDLTLDSRDLTPTEAEELRSLSLQEETLDPDGENEVGEPQRVVQLVASLDLPADIVTSSGNVTASALGPGGDYAVLADRHKMVHLVGLKSHLDTISLGQAESMATAVAIDPNRGEVYAAGFDGKVVRWNLDLAGGQAQTEVEVSDRILALDIDQRGVRLAIGTERGRALLYDLRTERIVEVHRASSPISVIRFVPHASQLFIGCWEGQMKTLDIATRDVLARLEPLQEAPMATAVDPEGRMAALVDASRRLRVVSLTEPSAYLRIEASYARLEALAFATDGKLNGLGIRDDDLQLWLVRNQHALQHLAAKSSVTDGE